MLPCLGGPRPGWRRLWSAVYSISLVSDWSLHLREGQVNVAWLATRLRKGRSSLIHANEVSESGLWSTRKSASRLMGDIFEFYWI